MKWPGPPQPWEKARRLSVRPTASFGSFTSKPHASCRLIASAMSGFSRSGRFRDTMGVHWVGRPAFVAEVASGMHYGAHWSVVSTAVIMAGLLYVAFR